MTIGNLSLGDTYANGKYKVLSNDNGIIKILRLADIWYISFHDKQVNLTHPVVVDKSQTKLF